MTSKKKPARRASKAKAKSYAQPQPAPAGSTAFTELCSSANANAGYAANLLERSTALGDRLFGTHPEKPNESGKMVADGAVSALAMQLGLLAETLTALSDQITRLETLA